MRIHMSTGNDKIGKIVNFSTLPGDKPIMMKGGIKLTDTIGTCTGCCEGCMGNCYAVKSVKRYPTARKAWEENTLIMRDNMEEGFKQMKEYLIKKKAKIFRYNVSGELENYEQLLGLVKLAKELPDVKIYFYTKRFGFVERYLKDGVFPSNLICNISEWHNNTAGFELKGLNRFVYDDHTNEEISKLTHCPAVDKNGKRTGITCSQCGRCYTNTGNKTAVYAH